MNSLRLPASNYKILDENDEIILEAPIMDLYYGISFAASESNSNVQRDQMKYAAAWVNNEYGCNLSWSHILLITEALDKEIKEIKKKPAKQLESPDGSLESTSTT